MDGVQTGATSGAPTFNSIEQSGNEITLGTFNFNGGSIDAANISESELLSSLVVSWDDHGAFTTQQTINNAISEIVDIQANRIKLHRLDEQTFSRSAGLVENDPTSPSPTSLPATPSIQPMAPLPQPLEMKSITPLAMTHLILPERQRLTPFSSIHPNSGSTSQAMTSTPTA